MGTVSFATSALRAQKKEKKMGREQRAEGSDANAWVRIQDPTHGPQSAFQIASEETEDALYHAAEEFAEAYTCAYRLLETPRE